MRDALLELIPVRTALPVIHVAKLCQVRVLTRHRIVLQIGLGVQLPPIDRLLCSELLHTIRIPQSVQGVLATAKIDCIVSYYLVFKYNSYLDMHGLIMAIIQVLALSPTKESLSTWVNLLARNGRWAPFLPRALMHSLRARRDLFISAPSNLVCLSAELVSAPLSLPARSMRENFPCSGFRLVFSRNTIWKTA